MRPERRDALLERVASLAEVIAVLQAIRASHGRADDKSWTRPYMDAQM